MLYLAPLLLFAIVNALPDGAPTKVCETMLPNHGGGIPPQPPPPVFVVTTIKREGDVIVTIKSPVEVPFQGFMLQARGTDGKLLGRFQPITPRIHTIDCNGTGDTLTHNNTDSRTAIDAQWFAPDGFEGTVIFNATVAQNFAIFWVGIESSPIEVQRRSVPQNYSPEPFTTTPKVIQSTPPHFTPSTEFQGNSEELSDPFYEGCLEIKNCFGSPAGCLDSQDCNAVASVTVRGEQYIFEMKAKNKAKWVGVGLSDDTQMGDDSVIECVDDVSIKAFMSKTTPRPNLGVNRLSRPQDGIQLLNGNKTGDTIYCRVQRDMITNVDGEEYDLSNTQYYLLIAAGTNIRPNRVGFHDLVSQASGAPIYLAEVGEVGAASRLLLQLHGAFMTIAWIGTASVGIILARYYRKTWVGKTLMGKDLWFAWHRNLMILTWALTTAAFVIIFVELKAWSTERNPHAVLGIIVTILCFVQPIGAYFRPHPGTPKRSIFNWAHWLGGNVAHIMAIITIFFAAELNKAKLPDWFDWILAAFVVLYVAIHLILTLMQCISEKSSQERGMNVFAMKELSGAKKTSQHMVNTDAPYSRARKALLTLYLVGVIGLVIALVVVIVLAPVD